MSIATSHVCDVSVVSSAIVVPSSAPNVWTQGCCHTSGRPSFCRYYGPELTAEAFVDWCLAQRIAIGYIQPGKPDQNGFIERFNRTFREEVLDAYLFDSLEQVQEISD